MPDYTFHRSQSRCDSTQLEVRVVGAIENLALDRPVGTYLSGQKAMSNLAGHFDPRSGKYHGILDALAANDCACSHDDARSDLSFDRTIDFAAALNEEIARLQEGI